MIRLTGVSKEFAGQGRVLEHINLELKKSDFLYVVGGTGAGKSTLLRMLATEEPASLGTLSLFGFNLSSVSPNTLCAIRRSIGYIPQDVQLIPDLTVFDNIALSISLAGKRVLSTEVRSRIGLLLDRLGLMNKRNALAGKLSRGEAQRVAVARALVRSPELVIADEPTGAQDRDYTWQLMDLFQRVNQSGATVVLATHDREIVRRFRKRCAVLRGGRLTVEEALCIY